MFLDGSGVFHVTFWDKEENALRYARRVSGVWTLETIASARSGIRSAVVADGTGKVHVAYLEEANNGQAILKYALRQNNSWTTQTLVGDTLVGPYRKETTFPSYRQPSVDIQLTPGGRPFVAFFHGWIGQLFPCSLNTLTAYFTYLLELRVLVQQPNGSWQKAGIPNIPNISGTNCLPRGDRFGEYCAIARGPGGRHYIATTSMHNQRVLLFQAADSNLTSWNYAFPDSMLRTRTAAQIEFYNTFEHFALANGNDTALHLGYGISNLYGNLSLPAARQAFYYSRVNPQSLFTSGQSNAFFRDMMPLKDGIYRRYFTLAAKGIDSVYYGWYDELNSQVVMGRSINRGQSFTTDTLRNLLTDARLSSAIRGDSLFLLAYDAEGDRLVLAGSALGGNTWRREAVTQTERRAQVVDGEVLRIGNEARQWLVIDEAVSGQLFSGKKTNGQWEWQAFDQSGRSVAGISLELDTDLAPVAAYSWRTTNQLRIWKEGNTPVNVTTPVEESPRGVSLTLAADGWHILYQDFGRRRLRYGFSSQWNGPWTLFTLDSLSGNTGFQPAMKASATGNLHAAWWDEAAKELKYAKKSPGGAWVVQTVPDTILRSISQVKIALGPEELPRIAFRDVNSNSVMLALQQPNGDWALETVASVNGNLIGLPLDLLTDHEDRPWIVYNVADAQDLIKLARRDDGGQWQEVSVAPNPDFVANAFVFLREGLDFYVFGRTNSPSVGGVGSLYAFNGATTRLTEEMLAETAFFIAPNPVQESIAIHFTAALPAGVTASLYDLQGRKVRTLTGEGPLQPGQLLEMDASSLVPGLYVLRVQSGNTVWMTKVQK